MKLSIATLVISAMLACTANAAPLLAPPHAKHRVVMCDHARPGTKLWKECHPKKAPKIIRHHKAPLPR